MACWTVQRSVLHYSVDELHEARGPASSSTAASSWVGLASTVYGAMRSEGGRAKLREAASMVFEALLRDLTEGRPDCRRLSAPELGQWN